MSGLLFTRYTSSANTFTLQLKQDFKTLRHIKLKLAALLLFLAAVPAHAGLLDLLKDGVKYNPDRYASFDLRATYGHDTGHEYVNWGDFYGIPGANLNFPYQANDRGIKGLFLLPLDENSTFIFGGGLHFQDYAFDQTNNSFGSPAQGGSVHGYTVETGLKFYIHE